LAVGGFVPRQSELIHVKSLFRDVPNLCQSHACGVLSCEESKMRKTITAMVAASTIATTATFVTPKPAEARCWGCWAGAGIAAGIIGGAIIAGAANAYGYGYGGYGYGGYGFGYPAYYPPVVYAPAYPAYYGYAASAYYGGYYAPPYYGGGYYVPRPYYAPRYVYYRPRYYAAYYPRRWHHRYW
jgi:hypothetical protein